MIPGALRHHAATLAVIAGAGCFAAALGGLSTIDDELSAAAPARTTETQVVDFHDDCPFGRGEA